MPQSRRRAERNRTEVEPAPETASDWRRSDLAPRLNRLGWRSCGRGRAGVPACEMAGTFRWPEDCPTMQSAGTFCRPAECPTLGRTAGKSACLHAVASFRVACAARLFFPAQPGKKPGSVRLQFNRVPPARRRGTNRAAHRARRAEPGLVRRKSPQPDWGGIRQRAHRRRPRAPHARAAG